MSAQREAGAPGARIDSLSPLFDPRSVAVVGASDDLSRIGGRLLRYLTTGGFTGEIHPVNPRRATVQDIPAIPSVADVEGDPDVAVLALPARAVAETLEACAERGFRAAVVLSAGFSETGRDGVAAQRRIGDIARAAEMRLLGPNCLGVLNSASGFYGTFANALARGLPTPGPIAICSQSGAYGAHLLYLARRRGIGVTYWITTGNEADVDLADAIAWMALRPEIKVVAAYAEGIRDGDRFMEALRLAHETRTAVVLTKVGTSVSGAKAANSHTAALAGSEAAYEAVFEHYGVLRATGAEELLDTCYMCARAKPPRGSRLGVVTVSGGAGVQACDAAERSGLTIPPLPAAAQEELRILLPYAGVANPIDVTAQALQQIDVLATALRLALGCGAFDSVFAFFTTTPLAPAFAAPLRAAIGEGTADRGDEPIVLCMIADESVVREYEAAGFLVFEDIDRAIAALAALTRLGRAWASELPDVRAHPRMVVEALPARPLSERESKRLIAAAGVPVPVERLVQTADEAVAAADEVGYPAALKVVSAGLPHKSEVGGVELDLVDGESMRAAFERMHGRVGREAPHALIEGVLVTPMAPEGIEMIVGVDRDPTFGPLVMVGLGGAFVEVLADVAFRLAPIDEREARQMIEQLAGAALLAGARGRPVADVDALAKVVASISRFAAAHGSRLQSLDVNPVLVLPVGQGVVALDAVITPATAADGSANQKGKRTWATC